MKCIYNKYLEDVRQKTKLYQLLNKDSIYVKGISLTVYGHTLPIENQVKIVQRTLKPRHTHTYLKCQRQGISYLIWVRYGISMGIRRNISGVKWARIR